MADVFIDRSRFAAALRGRREALGLSKRQLASRAKISDAYLGSLEQGGSIPGIDVLAKLASALKARPDELLADYGLQLRASDIPELDETYSALDPPDRYALLHIGRALREARERYGTEEEQRQNTPVSDDSGEPAAETDDVVELPDELPDVAYDKKDLTKKLLDEHNDVTGGDDR